MNTRTRNLTLLASLAALTACGLQSGSNRFGFDGIGDPRPPDGNIIAGKYHGTFEITRFRTQDPKISPLFGNDFSVVQGLFSKNPVEGLAALPLLVIGTTPPPRETGVEHCYEDLGVFPELGGNLQFVDVGPSISLKVQNTGTQSNDIQSVTRDPDANFSNPQSDQIIYISNFNVLKTFAYDFNQEMTWGGGTLDSKGFFAAPARTDLTPVIHFPAELVGPANEPNPTVNGQDMLTSTLPNSLTYKIKWKPTTASADMGVQIIVQVYGPANLAAAGDPPDINDLPYFNKLGQLVCLAKESDGTAGFNLDRQLVDTLVSHIKQTTAYAHSTEDGNGDGTVSNSEDANNNNLNDKVYGAVLILNRRVEQSVPVCLAGSGSTCTQTGPVFFSANATKMNHTKWVPAIQ